MGIECLFRLVNLSVREVIGFLLSFFSNRDSNKGEDVVLVALFGM